MAISEKLAKQALAKIQQQEREIQALKARLGEDVLGDAIQKSLEAPASGQPRNRIVTAIVKDGLFRGEKPVSKSSRQKTESERKEKLKRELQIAKGLRPK